MARVKCRTCSGEYDTVQRGGLLYFHACPPVETVTVQRAGAVIDVDAAAVQAGDRELRRRFVRRPNGRDENLIVTGYDARGNPITAMKSGGAGVDSLPPLPADP